MATATKATASPLAEISAITSPAVPAMGLVVVACTAPPSRPTRAAAVAPFRPTHPAARLASQEAIPVGPMEAPTVREPDETPLTACRPVAVLTTLDPVAPAGAAEATGRMVGSPTALAAFADLGSQIVAVVEDLAPTSAG